MPVEILRDKVKDAILVKISLPTPLSVLTGAGSRAGKVGAELDKYVGMEALGDCLKEVQAAHTALQADNSKVDADLAAQVASFQDQAARIKAARPTVTGSL